MSTRQSSLMKIPATPASSFASGQSGLLGRKCACGKNAGPTGECGQCRKKRAGVLQRRAATVAADPDTVPPIVHDVLRSSGQPLDPTLRSFMEPRFGRDFGQVRVHTDARAAESAQTVNAQAYTVGHHLVFGTGQYAPQNPAGRRLVSHELAHVVQQAGQDCVRPTSISPAETPAERQAEIASRSVMSGGAAPQMAPASAAVHRQPGTGDQRPDKRRQEAEARLPATFPPRGVRIIGTGAGALVGILHDCTGLPLEVDSSQLLVQQASPPAQSGKAASATARTELLRIINASAGIIIDTNPAAPGAMVGVFGMDTPGYQQLDVGNVQILGAASGIGGGLSACDAVMHEISEALYGRQLSLAKAENYGQRAFTPSHAEGLRVEQGIRRDLGVPQRSSTEQGNTVVIGNEDPSTLVLLESMMFGDGAKARTQLSVYRCHLLATSEKDKMTCDNEAVASTVVRGIVHFSTQMEALRIFNQNAAAFGLSPIPVPKEPQNPKEPQKK